MDTTGYYINRVDVPCYCKMHMMTLISIVLAHEGDHPELPGVPMPPTVPQEPVLPKEPVPKVPVVPQKPVPKESAAESIPDCKPKQSPETQLPSVPEQVDIDNQLYSSSTFVQGCVLITFISIQ